MKLIIFIALAFIGCNAHKEKEYTDYIIVGTDTIVVKGFFNLDFSKTTSAIRGHNDTVSGIFTTRLTKYPGLIEISEDNANLLYRVNKSSRRLCKDCDTAIVYKKYFIPQKADILVIGDSK